MIAIRTALVGLLALSSAGCGGGSVPFYPVKGTITFNGKPYPDANVAFVPEPDNAAITAGVGATDAEGNYAITSEKSGLSAGKYRVVVTPNAPEGGQYEDEEQRRMALASLGIDPLKQAAKEGRPGGEFQAEVKAEANVFDFEVKGKAAKP
ncbi:carboxypeptidase-like regulatory domain-containing protein [Tundrisphaera sp. TA3]|uniref:carboxypeptidase-like regulatory domain-containing protein n=1 Tax=Tundrisphaera sp. TA3 TaxID=3435775 RepID=UPI003EBD2EF9